MTSLVSKAHLSLYRELALNPLLKPFRTGY
jgi:hypothetical protein